MLVNGVSGTQARTVILGLLVCLSAQLSPVSHADVIQFTQGVDLWLSSSDVMDTGNPNLGWGRNLGANARNYDSVIKFTDMFGNDPGQIPAGSIINEAILYMWIGYDGGLESFIYQMTYDWNASSTWTTLGSTGGIVPGVNTQASFEHAWTGTTDDWSQRQFLLTSSVQEWSDGTPNYGWGFTRERYDTVTAMSLDATTPSYRPYLAVDYTIPEPATLALAALSSCLLYRRRRGTAKTVLGLASTPPNG